MKYWTTKEGDDIPYKKLGDEHLLNILAIIKKWEKTGIEIIVGWGFCDDDDFPTREVEMIEGKEVLDRYDYKGLLKEAKKRNLIIKL